MPIKPVINYKTFTDSTNNKIAFRESGTGSMFLATLTAAANPSTGEYGTNVKTAMDAAGNEAYNVTYSRTTRKYTVASSAGAYLTIDWTTAASAGGIMGFATGAKDTGATSYIADTTSGTEIRFTEGVRDFKEGHQSEGSFNQSDNGKRETNFKFLEEFYSIDWTLVDVAEKVSYELFSTGWASKGLAFDYYPSGTGSSFFRLQLQDPFRKIEFTKSMGLDRYAWSDGFRFER